MPYKYIIVEKRGRITIITINRIDAHNALHFDANAELDAAFNEFAADKDQWVAIITGAGTKAFCAGFDLKFRAAGGSLDTPPSGFGGVASRFDLDKPVIAAVNGIAMGGGFEIVLACDIVIAAEHAAFALPEPKVGLAALAGGLYRLPRAIGMTRALGMLLTGRRVTGSEGFTMGFVTEVTSDDVLEAAMRWAEELAQCSPVAVRAAKNAVARGSMLSIENAIQDQWDFPAVKALLASDDAQEGPAAFSEKRTPVWRSE